MGLDYRQVVQIFQVTYVALKSCGLQTASFSTGKVYSTLTFPRFRGLSLDGFSDLDLGGGVSDFWLHAVSGGFGFHEEGQDFSRFTHYACVVKPRTGGHINVDFHYRFLTFFRYKSH